MQKDKLLSVRNNYYLGAYDKTIEGLKDSPASFESRLLLLKCYLAQGECQNIKTATRGETIPELIALSLLINPSKSNADAMQELVASTDPSAGLGEGSGVPVLAGMFYYLVGMYDEACRVLASRPKDLEWYPHAYLTS
jgi:hypothetical protein